MLKINSLREAMTKSARWCKANPEKLTIFVEGGNIETTGETPSFAYSYNLVVFAMDFPGHIDDFTLPLMAWLWKNQPALLLNPEENKNIKFSVAINNDDSADILYEIPVRERVRVSRDEAGDVTAEHLPEPRPRVLSDSGVWGSVFDDATFKGAV